MSDPFIRIANDWEETTEEMVERWEREYPPKLVKTNGVKNLTAIGRNGQEIGAPAVNNLTPLNWLDMSNWDRSQFQNVNGQSRIAYRSTKPACFPARAVQASQSSS